MNPRLPSDEEFKRALKVAKMYPDVHKFLLRQHALHDQLVAAERDKDVEAVKKIVQEGLKNVCRIMDIMKRKG